jgi:hypothetical protein
MIKSRNMKWPWYVGNEEKMNACRIVVGKPEGKRTLGRPTVSGKIILKWILER